MATEKAAKVLREKITSALAFREKSLESRSQWGSITFEKASPDFRRVFEILSHLSVLPLDYLTDQATSLIQSEVDQVINVLTRIDQFNIEQQSPPQVRDGLVGELHGRADQLYTVASPWVPFLAYQKGDVAKNIEALTASVTQAQSLVDQAKRTIENRQNEIEAIITQAREASAAAGAAVFTHDFRNEANAMDGRAKTWLRITAGLAAVTLAFTFVMWFWPAPPTETSIVIQRLGAKLAVLVVLFTATLWCGRTYKALMHLSTVNRHRALSLQTFQAFSHAASDKLTKDAVLLEATRAIFGLTPTGFLDGRASADQEVKVVEIAKSLGTRSASTST